MLLIKSPKKAGENPGPRLLLVLVKMFVVAAVANLSDDRCALRLGYGLRVDDLARLWERT